MILLGISGAIGHGKTTLAETIMQIQPDSAHIETSMIIAEVADALHKSMNNIPKSNDLASINHWLETAPKIIASITHKNCDFKDIGLKRSEIQQNPTLYEKLFVHLDNLKNTPSLIEQSISTNNKASYRPFLQWLGAYLVKKVDPGIWYDEMITRLIESKKDICIIGGVRFPGDAEVIRRNSGIIINIVRPKTPELESLDPTEIERHTIVPDLILHNNGDFSDLKRCAKQLLNDAKNSHLKTVYTAGPNT